MSYVKYLTKSIIFSLAVVSLAGCMKMYNLRPETKAVALRNVQQVSLYGPYRTEIFIGAKKPHLTWAASMGGQLTEVLIQHTHHQLQIKPTRAAIPDDLSHMTLKIYVTRLNELNIDHGGIVRIHSNKAAHYSLVVKNSAYVLLKGGAVIPNLQVVNTTNLDITGPVYLSHVRFIGPGNTTVEGIKGGKLSVYASGAGYLKLKGVYTLVSLVQHGPAKVLLDGKIKGGNLSLHIGAHRTISMHGLELTGLSFDAYGTDKLNLSGYVGNLRASLSDNAQLNGQYLTVRNAEIKTCDQAVAKLHVNRRIFALTQGSSRVDYTGNPKYRYVHAKGTTSILPISAPPPNSLILRNFNVSIGKNTTN